MKPKLILMFSHNDMTVPDAMFVPIKFMLDYARVVLHLRPLSFTR